MSDIIDVCECGHERLAHENTSGPCNECPCVQYHHDFSVMAADDEPHPDDEEGQWEPVDPNAWVTVANSVWFAVVDDLIGGWAITLEDKPLSQHSEGLCEIASFVSREAAEHIVELHNQSLGR